MSRREPGAPAQITANGPDDFLEAMTKSVFQAGISWEVVDAKWPGICEALWNFDAERLAHMDGPDVDALMADPRVIRNRKKLEATASNAARLVELDREHGGFRKYLRSHGDFAGQVKALRKDFKFLGEFGCYVFLYVVKEPVPEYHEWRAAHPVSPRPQRSRR